MARVPFAMASVGAGKVDSRTSRFFLSSALRMAQYRSYRDKNSRKIASDLLPRAGMDPVVPDLAFNLPSSELPLPAGIRAIAPGRTIVAISPMAFAKPQSWPTPDRALYDRYVQEMARVVTQLLERQYFLVIVWSASSDQGSAVQDLLGLIDPESKKRFAGQMYVPTITTWKELVALLLDVDFLIATRLHSVILGFGAQKPTLAISFDPKVDWVMEDLGLTDYLLPIRDFKAENVVEGLERSAVSRQEVTEKIGSYQKRVLSASARQYDTLVELGKAVRSNRN
jgi:polysaccharide pyruvyl transferase WcaK-like protein